MNTPAHDAYVTRYAPGRLILLVFGCLVFVVAGLWMADVFGNAPVPSEGARQRIPDWMVGPLGWFCVVFFGAAGIASGKRMFSPQESLRIDAQGIRWLDWSDKTVPWQQIISVTHHSTMGQGFMVLTLRDPDLFPGRGLKGVLAGMNRAMIDGDIAVTMQGTDGKLADAFAAAEYFRPKTRPVPGVSGSAY